MIDILTTLGAAVLLAVCICIGGECLYQFCKSVWPRK